MFGLAILIIVIVSLPIIRMIVGAVNKEGSRAVENTAKGIANMSDALPTMGASFAASSIADSMQEVPVLKAALGINDSNIITMPQLHAYMREHGMM